MAIFFFIGILTLLVLAHELGHFAMAKLFKVKVLEFGIGFPPRVFKVTYKDTNYTFNLLPLGGFVRMLGEDRSTDENSFSQKNPWQRLAILSAGSIMNLILPFFLFWAVLTIPHSIPTTNVVILEISPNSPAEEAGLATGDIIRTVDGHAILTSADLITVIKNTDSPSTWVIKRNQSLQEISIPKARNNPPEGQGPVGIRIGAGRVFLENIDPESEIFNLGFKNNDLLLKINEQTIQSKDAFIKTTSNSPIPLNILLLRGNQFINTQVNSSTALFTAQQVAVLPSSTHAYGFLESIPLALKQMVNIFQLIHREVTSVLKGSGQIQFAGPIGIAQITGDAAKAGFSSLVLWAAILSINLAILNLLPIPALDGGRIVFVLIELIAGGRRLAPNHEKLIHLIGFFSLIGLILMVSINDIQRIIGPT
ncbi:MAG: RIP metalloprotease RseP [SAR202 cluster bacterium]|nr:RIP metalloprotease RseP [SAR202 cluster bacterium]|tara:strand:- start:9410 stop:10678 length:1269 start_codon:yes stop_codon:yes gene_type:complete